MYIKVVSLSGATKYYQYIVLFVTVMPVCCYTLPFESN